MSHHLPTVSLLYSSHVSRCPLKSLKPFTCLPHFPLCLFTSPLCTVLPPLVYLFILQSTSRVSALASSPCPDLPGSFFHSTFPDPCRNYFSLLPRTPRSLRLLVFSFLSTTGINKTWTVFMTREARIWHLDIYCSTFKLAISHSFRSLELGNFVIWNSTRCRRQEAMSSLPAWHQWADNSGRKTVKQVRDSQSQAPSQGNGGITEQCRM